MIHDFLIHRGRRSLHVCNSPSPAATAALPIGRHLADQFDEAFGELAIFAARSLDMPLSLRASYCFSFLTWARFPGIATSH